MRTFAIFLVVLLHSGLVYESVLDKAWIVSDPDKINALGLIRMYLDLFVMFVIFFISGYFVPGSVKNKTTREFLVSKLKRIMLPWAIAVLTLIPAYKAIFLYSRGMPQQEWYTYFHFFQRPGADLAFFANNPTQNWLWFLPVLFIFQAIYLAWEKLRIPYKSFTLKQALILTFAGGLVYAMTISVLGLKGWYHSALIDFQRERLVVYLFVFILGAVCYKQKAFESGRKNKRLYVVSNIILTVSLGIYTAVALNLFYNIITPGRNYFFVSEFADRSFYYATGLLSMLSFLYIFIHVFRFSFNRKYRIMEPLNRNSYQVYILHTVVMGTIALVLMRTPLPAMVKYALLVILSFALTNLLVSAYHLVFRDRTTLKATAFVASVILLFVIIQAGNSTEKSDSHPEVISPAIGLHEAVLMGDTNALRQHICAGSDLDIPEPSIGSSPLITAAAFGKTEVALLLIEAGADVNFQNIDGATPLHTAAFFCRPLIVEALLKNGADKTVKNHDGSTAIESVLVPFEDVRGAYEYFQNTLGPLGLKLDPEELQKTRPAIADMLRN
jgi:hypothetical protein